MSPRLFWSVASLEARTHLSYRFNFWLNALVGFLVELAIAWFLWDAVFRVAEEPTIGGRDFDGTLVYYLAVILLAKLVRGREFEGAVSHDIYEGGLNRYLVFPAPYVPFKLAQRLGSMLAPGIAQMVLFGAFAAVFFRVPEAMRPTAASALGALAAVAMASLLYFLMDAAIHMVAFWADNVWSLDVAKWFVASLLGGYMLPLSVFPDWAQRPLELLPFRFFFDFPARVLVREIGPGEWALGMALCAFWCLVCAGICRWIWRRGQLTYTGIGI